MKYPVAALMAALMIAADVAASELPSVELSAAARSAVQFGFFRFLLATFLLTDQRTQLSQVGLKIAELAELLFFGRQIKIHQSPRNTMARS